jgi:hypothetical protein
MTFTNLKDVDIYALIIDQISDLVFEKYSHIFIKSSYLKLTEKEQLAADTYMKAINDAITSVKSIKVLLVNNTKNKMKN